MKNRINTARRRFITYSGSILGLSALPGGLLHAASLLPTPRQSAGPFYPDSLPLDTDNDLIHVADGPAAKGTATNVFGQLLDRSGNAVAGARIEIWQCDANGRYHHPDDSNPASLDPNFQAFGSTITDQDGRYRFRTIKPVSYPGRTPHIHFRIKGDAFNSLTTQMYIRGEPQNDRDGIFRRLRSIEAKNAVQAEFLPDPGATAELQARWDIVLGIEDIFEKG